MTNIRMQFPCTRVPPGELAKPLAKTDVTHFGYAHVTVVRDLAKVVY